jgi:hypothetical protein
MSKYLSKINVKDKEARNDDRINKWDWKGIQEKGGKEI